MYFVYIAENNQGKHYIGATSNVDARIKKHNHHGNRSTRQQGPWKLIYKEECATKEKAFKRERQIKKYKGGNALKKLLRRDAGAV
jgi:putative endonuclease